MHAPRDAAGAAAVRVRLTLVGLAKGAKAQEKLHAALAPVFPELAGVPDALVKPSSAAACLSGLGRWGAAAAADAGGLISAGLVLRRGATTAKAAAVVAALATVGCRAAKAELRQERYAVGELPASCGLCNALCVAGTTPRQGGGGLALPPCCSAACQKAAWGPGGAHRKEQCGTLALERARSLGGGGVKIA